MIGDTPIPPARASGPQQSAYPPVVRLAGSGRGRRDRGPAMSRGSGAGPGSPAERCAAASGATVPRRRPGGPRAGGVRSSPWWGSGTTGCGPGCRRPGLSDRPWWRVTPCAVQSRTASRATSRRNAVRRRSPSRESFTGRGRAYGPQVTAEPSTLVRDRAPSPLRVPNRPGRRCRRTVDPPSLRGSWAWAVPRGNRWAERPCRRSRQSSLRLLVTGGGSHGGRAGLNIRRLTRKLPSSGVDAMCRMRERHGKAFSRLHGRRLAHVMLPVTNSQHA